LGLAGMVSCLLRLILVQDADKRIFRLIFTHLRSLSLPGCPFVTKISYALVWSSDNSSDITIGQGGECSSRWHSLGLFIRESKIVFGYYKRNAAFMPQPNGDINVYNICAFNANVAQ